MQTHQMLYGDETEINVTPPRTLSLLKMKREVPQVRKAARSGGTPGGWGAHPPTPQRGGIGQLDPQ